VTISLLDALAGSPPTAAQRLLRLAPTRGHAALGWFLEEWERWTAERLESHLSFPVLSDYRSQHDNQSWLAALTAILETSSLVLAGVEQVDPYQAKLTFAMARHAVVDLAQVFRTPPVETAGDRLPAGDLRRLGSPEVCPTRPVEHVRHGSRAARTPCRRSRRPAPPRCLGGAPGRNSAACRGCGRRKRRAGVPRRRGASAATAMAANSTPLRIPSSSTATSVTIETLNSNRLTCRRRRSAGRSISPRAETK
jgi:hypothetical protein